MILPSIETPADLKGLHRDELAELCAEIRAFVVETVTTTGGRTTTSQTTSHSTYVTTVNRPRRYQPMGSGAFNPKGY